MGARCVLIGHIKKTDVRSQMTEFQGVACGDGFKIVDNELRIVSSR